MKLITIRKNFKMIALIVGILMLTSHMIVEAQRKIFGGTEAGDGKYPYLISIRENGQHVCGGSIINSNNILTAAHCVYKTDPSTLKIVAGTNKLNEGGVMYPVAHYKYHSGFSTEDGSNDIALINPYGSIQFTPKIQPTSLGSVYIPGNVYCVFAGWGLTEYSSRPVNNLQEIVLRIIDRDECQNTVATITGNEVGESNICTLTSRGSGLCVGDSGSPLIHNGQQIGLASWVAKCARGYPDIFTRTYSYHNWIQSQMFH